MHAQRGESAFRSSEQSHFQVIRSTRILCRIRTRRRLSSAHPLNSTSWFFQTYTSSEMAGRSRQSPRFPAASVKQALKNRRGEEPAAERCGRQAEARITFHSADLRNLFTKWMWLSVRFATLELGNYRPLAPHIAS
jgi:hypothetical protein